MTSTDHIFENSGTNGRWTQQEHNKFIVGLKLYGKNWKKIQELIKTRTGSQIRSHAQKFFMKLSKSIDEKTNDGSNEESHQLTQKPIIQVKMQPHQYHNTSYYLERIQKIYLQKKQISFWETLIDRKAILLPEKTQPTNKKSFIYCLDGNEQAQLRGIPTKKIKL